MVTDDAACDHVDAERGQPIGNRARVRVDATQCEQFAADGNGLGTSKRRGRHASIHAGATQASNRTHTCA